MTPQLENAAKQGRGHALLPLLLGLTLLSACNSKEARTEAALQQAVTTDCPDAQTGLLAKARATKALKVVAIGSSTTQGVGASQPQYSYVSRLRSDLMAELPGVQVTVINAGIGGETLKQIDARWNRVMQEATREGGPPDLIILQTGINDAILKVDQQEFRTLLLKRLSSQARAGMVMVMGNQYIGPDEAARIPKLSTFNALIQQVAQETGTPYINRYKLLKTLIEQKVYPPDDLYAPDHLHASDLGYHVLEQCVLHRSFGL